jgi:DNA-binding transcriptional regulator LsrR (DeoR family)
MGMSLTQVASKHSISRASVCRLMNEANGAVMPAAEILGQEFQL